MNEFKEENLSPFLLFNEAIHWGLGRQGVMAAMATLLPLYGVM